MKNLIIISIFLMPISCNEKNTSSVKKNEAIVATKKTISETKGKFDTAKFSTSKVTDAQNEVMREDEILFNGKLTRYFTLRKFEQLFGKADSIKLMSEEEPCSYIFINKDGSKNIDDKYLYKDGSKFENSKNKVAVDEFRFTKNNFLLYKGIKLNAATTISDLQKIFPNAVNNIGTMDVYGEGILKVIQLREDKNNISEGHIEVFIKNGKLYFMHWWFPC
jgi:hypothetical protein